VLYRVIDVYGKKKLVIWCGPVVLIFRETGKSPHNGVGCYANDEACCQEEPPVASLFYFIGLVPKKRMKKRWRNKKNSG
jgi:hypothetical protein